MKKAIAILSIILGLLVALFLALTLFEKKSEGEKAPETQPVEATSFEAAVEATEPSTQIPTETGPSVVSEPLSIVLEGKDLPTVLIDGQRYVCAADFANALGLSVSSMNPLMMSGDFTVTETEQGISLQLDGVETLLTEAPFFIEGRTYLPFDSLMKTLEYPEFVDEEMGITYYTPSAKRFEIPQGIHVPVLMYHAVGDEVYAGGAEELFASPSVLEQQLQFLADNGYQTIFFEDLAHLEDYDKPVILTFDDGYDDNYTNLFPLLKQFNAKATVFVIGNAPGTPNKMTAEQIREMSDSGLVSIQSHSYTHPDMDYLDTQQTEEELALSKLAIIRITGKEPSVFCYPSGRFNSYTLELAPNYYMFGIKMNGGLYNTSDDPFLVSRYYVSRYLTMDGFKEMVRYAGSGVD